MDGEQRRREIMDVLRTTKAPVSGAFLGKKFHVSRQVIVQDIALIRASCPGIISTHRGYIMTQPAYVSRVFKVCHGPGQIEDELNRIVDALSLIHI